MPPTNSLRLSGASAAFSTPISTARLMSSGMTDSSRRRRSLSLIEGPRSGFVPCSRSTVNVRGGGGSSGLLEDAGDAPGGVFHGRRSRRPAAGAKQHRVALDLDRLDVHL